MPSKGVLSVSDKGSLGGAKFHDLLKQLPWGYVWFPEQRQRMVMKSSGSEADCLSSNHSRSSTHQLCTSGKLLFSGSSSAIAPTELLKASIHVYSV